jgi:hypothetical protein
MQDRQRYFEGRMASDARAAVASKVEQYFYSTPQWPYRLRQGLDASAVLHEARGNLDAWDANLAQVSLIHFSYDTFSSQSRSPAQVGT